MVLLLTGIIYITFNLSLAAYWWVVVTMTTVGYGDFYPTNALGYVAATMVMIFGLILTALPVAIIGGNFTVYYEYSQRRLERQGGQLKAA